VNAAASAATGVIEDWTRMRHASCFGDDAERQAAEIELVRGATASFDPDAYRAGRQTPVLFGSAISNSGRGTAAGVRRQRACAPAARVRRAQRAGYRAETHRLVFKIQANMDPGHRDRIAFLRLCSGATSAALRHPARALEQGAQGLPMR